MKVGTRYEASQQYWDDMERLGMPPHLMARRTEKQFLEDQEKDRMFAFLFVLAVVLVVAGIVSAVV